MKLVKKFQSETKSRAPHKHVLKKILWAIDALEYEPHLQRNVVELLRKLGRKTEASVQPIYVASPASFGSILNLKRESRERLTGLAKDRLDFVSKSSPIPHLLKPVILVEKKPSMNRAVKKLARYARSHNADAIVCTTHGKKGFDRFVLGSFAESLVQTSSTPVIAINPDIEYRHFQFHKILFATDFSPRSKTAWKKICRFALATGAEIEIWNVLERLIPLAYETIDPKLPSTYLQLPKLIEQHHEATRKIGRSMLKRAEKMRLHVNVYFDEREEPIKKLLMDRIEETDADLVAMVVETGPVLSSLLGSLTRSALREFHIPIWLY